MSVEEPVPEGGYAVFYNEVAAPETVTLLQEALGTGFKLWALQHDDHEAELASCRRADFMIAGWRPVPADSIEAADRLRVIHKAGAGVDKIALEAAARRGVIVTAAAGANAPQVAEHTILLMLAILRRLREAETALRAGDWPKNELRPRLRSLYGKAVGIVGFGTVGRAVARRLAGFECQLRYFDPRRVAEPEERNFGVTYRSLDELLAESDVVTLHVPLISETKGLISRRELASMRSDAVLVNTSRGEVVDRQALVEALQSGRLGGAGIDVFPTEPPGVDEPLLRMEQVVVTPHIAGSSRENIGRLGAQALEVFNAVLDGRDPPGRVR